MPYAVRRTVFLVAWYARPNRGAKFRLFRFHGFFFLPSAKDVAPRRVSPGTRSGVAAFGSKKFRLLFCSIIGNCRSYRRPILSVSLEFTRQSSCA